jgi:DNA-binding PadR family transcriptional regulator
LEHESGYGPRFYPRFGPAFGPPFSPEPFARHEHRNARGRQPRPGFTHGPGARLFERGGVKFAILEHLKEKPSHGYDIIRDMEERSGGFYSPSPGAIYPNLQALEDRDLVTSITEEGKKVYSITETGLEFLEKHKDRVQRHRERFDAHWDRGPAGEGWTAITDIRDTFGDMRRAVRRSMGDPAKLKEIGAVLEEAAAKVREIAKRQQPPDAS